VGLTLAVGVHISVSHAAPPLSARAAVPAACCLPAAAHPAPCMVMAGGALYAYQLVLEYLRAAGLQVLPLNTVLAGSLFPVPWYIRLVQDGLVHHEANEVALTWSGLVYVGVELGGTFPRTLRQAVAATYLHALGEWVATDSALCPLKCVLTGHGRHAGCRAR
jgi:hypothetical protein